jgi:alkylation response protein AidB-like acyl-CoA dehydrogenase
MNMLDLPLGPDQLVLRDAVQRFLADNPHPDWDALCSQIGLGGLTAPEAIGGFDGGASDMALIMAELGPALAGVEWLVHAAAVLVLAAVAPEHPALPGLATGSQRAALICAATSASMPQVRRAVTGYAISGEAMRVAGAARADILILADPLAILLAAPAERTARPMHDGTIAADLCLAGAAELLVDGAPATALAAFVNDVVLACRCAEAVGLTRRMIADTADYLGQRRQFGAPIGSFQTLRHRLADMQLSHMQAAALTELAIAALDSGKVDRAKAVSSACVAVRDAARKVGEGAVQLHGAMGLTEELELGTRFRRVLAIAAGLGSEAALLERSA